MPRYDYLCDLCGELFEVQHPMEGPREGYVPCPVCKTGRTHKIFIQAPAMKIWWKDARSSSDASGLCPRFMPSVKARKAIAALGGR